jgi:hypothetical protein
MRKIRKMRKTQIAKQQSHRRKGRYFISLKLSGQLQLKMARSKVVNIRI